MREKGLGGEGRPRSRRATLLVALLAALTLVTILPPSTTRAADAWSASGGAIVYAVATSADGSLVVAGRRDNTVVAYDATGVERWTFSTGGTVYDLSIAADGQRIA